MRTIAEIKQAALATTHNVEGECLHNCSMWCLDRPSGENDAYLDWQNTPAHLKLGPNAKPEPGMLAHWHHTAERSAAWHMAVGHPGHIALVMRVDADGTVWVRSTDMAPGKYEPGVTSTVKLHDVTQHMIPNFDGYSRAIAGETVVSVPAKKKPAKKAAAKHENRAPQKEKMKP